MKSHIILLALGVLAFQARSQSRPQTSMYTLNYFLTNPAFTGLENYADIRLGRRQQWSGISGAPVTTWVTANLPLGYTLDQSTPLSLPEEDDREEFFRLLPAQRHNGVGVIAYQDEVGPYVSHCFDASYAYHLPLTGTVALSLGFSGGVQSLSYDATKNIYPDQPIDPAVMNAYGSHFSPDANAGLLLYSSRFFAGASLQQIVPAKFINTYNSLSTYSKQWIFSGGYNFILDREEGVGLLLSGLVKTDLSDPLTFDVNAKCTFGKLWWIGASYRRQDAVSGMLGLHVLKNLNIAYAYDYILSPLGRYANGSHELVLAFQIFKLDGRWDPRVNW